MNEEADVTAAIIGLAQGLVDHPDEVEVSSHRRGESTIFVLRVAPTDVGQVIGRQGRTARALRALLEARSAEDQQSYDLEIQRS